MLALSKLLLGGCTLASAGGLSSFFIPKLISSGEEILYKTGIPNDASWNFEQLDQISEKKLSALNEWLEKLKKSKDWAKLSKEEKLKESIELLSKIGTNEESLEKLYKLIEEKLKDLQKQSKTLSDTIKERLQLDARFQQIKTSQQSLTQLVQLLTKRESSMNNMICAFVQAGEEQKQSECNRRSSSLISSAFQSNSSGGGDKSTVKFRNIIRHRRS